MSVAPDDAWIFARLNDVIQTFYSRPEYASIRHAAARALEAAYTAQHAAHARTYADSGYDGTEVIALPVSGTGGRSAGDLAIRAEAVRLSQVLYNTVASDGAHCLDPASEMTLLRIRGDLWQHLAGPYPASAAQD